MNPRLFWLLLLALALLAAVFLRPWESVPDAWIPWAPLEVDHSMNPVTRWKLENLKHAPAQCLAVLDAVPADAVDYVALADYTPVPECPLTNVVRVRRTAVEFNAAFTVTCPLAVAWLMFERQALQPLAAEMLGARIARIDHYGGFRAETSTTGRAGVAVSMPRLPHSTWRRSGWPMDAGLPSSIIGTTTSARSMRDT